MLSGTQSLLGTSPSAATSVHCQSLEAGHQAAAKLGGELGMRASGALGTNKDQSQGSTDTLQRPAGDPWRIASVPDFGHDDSLHGTGLRLPQDPLGGSVADTGSPWTPHNPAQPHPLDPFSSAQAAGFNLPFDGLEHSAASVVESVLGRDEFSSKDPGSTQPWNPAGLLGNSAYQLPMTISGQLRATNCRIGIDQRPDGSCNGAAMVTANNQTSKFPAMDRLANHGFGTSPWAGGAAAQNNLVGAHAGNGMGYMDPMEEQNFLGAMHSLSYQDQVMLQQFASQQQQQQQQQQAARESEQVLQHLLQQQREQQFNGQALPGVDPAALLNNIKTARSVPQQGAPAAFPQTGASRLGDPGRMQSGNMGMGMDEPISPMHAKYIMQALGQDRLASHGSHGLGMDDGSWTHMQDVARLLAMQASAQNGSHGLLNENLTSSGSFNPGNNMAGRGNNNVRQGMQAGGMRYEPSDSPNMQRQQPRLPHKLVQIANQVGLTTPMLWLLIKHPSLLDMLYKEREILRGGSQSAGGSTPAGTPIKSMVSMSTGGAHRRLVMPSSRTTALEQAIALMEPAKRQEELVKAQAGVADVMRKTASYLQSIEVHEMLTALAPLSALYDSMHDLPVVQKRRKCQEINEMRAVLGAQARVHEVVALLAKLRQHLYTMTERLLILSDASCEGVPLDIMLGCVCTELLNLLRPHVPQDVLEAFDTMLPSPRLALLVFVEFASVDPVPSK